VFIDDLRAQGATTPDFICFEMSDVIRMYHEHEKRAEFWHGIVLNTSIYPPYPRIWIEAISDEKNDHKRRWGVDLFLLDDDHPLPNRKLYDVDSYETTIDIYIKQRGKPAHFLVGSITVEGVGNIGIFVTGTDEKGMILRDLSGEGETVNTYLLDREMVMLSAEVEGTFERGQEVVRDSIAYCRRSTLFALAMLNVRNVMIDTHTRPEKMQRARVRRGKPEFVSYKTLRIVAPGQARREREGSSEPSQGIMPAHLVRAHTITGSEERPLFGKPWGVGTFIVPSHTRGSKEVGVALKDYRVDGAPDRLGLLTPRR
jgi:hypothetical protein